MKNDYEPPAAERAYEIALRYELDYGCCPQCVLAAVQETVGIVDDATIRASHGLSGGGGLCGAGTCGALVGGLMALSAQRGRPRDKLAQGRYIANFARGRELAQRFRDEFGGITCEDLQKRFTGRTWDLWDAAEYKAFGEARGPACARATATVTRWVVDMLQPPRACP